MTVILTRILEVEMKNLSAKIGLAPEHTSRVRFIGAGLLNIPSIYEWEYHVADGLPVVARLRFEIVRVFERRHQIFALGF